MTDVARHARAIGIAALLTGAASALTLVVDGAGSLGDAFSQENTIYGTPQVCLVVALGAVGIALLVAHSREVAGILIAVAALCAAQLAGAGIVGFRRWPLYSGMQVAHEEQVRALTAGIASVGLTTVLLCLAALMQIRCLGRRRVGLSVVAAALAALVVAVAVPSALVVGGWGGGDTGELLDAVLMYALPFAAALALSGPMERLVGLALVGAVAGCAVLVTTGSSSVAPGREPDSVMVLVALAAAAVAVAQLVDLRREVSSGATAPTHRASTPSPVPDRRSRERYDASTEIESA